MPLELKTAREMEGIEYRPISPGWRCNTCVYTNT